MPLDGYPHTWTDADVAHPYDPTAFTDPAGDFTWCRVTITYPSGETCTATGNYLHCGDRYPELLCGIFDLCSDLDLPEPSDPECLAVSDAVNRQLAWRPLVRLSCPEFAIRIDLVPPPSSDLL